MITQQILETYTVRLSELTTSTVIVDPGRKYLKVVLADGNSRRVHSFIEKNTGNLLKPASWKTPAKGVRYNLLTDLDTVLDVMDEYGSFLYYQ